MFHIHPPPSCAYGFIYVCAHVSYLSLQGQFLLQVLYFGLIPEKICLELLLCLKHEQINDSIATRALFLKKVFTDP